MVALCQKLTIEPVIVGIVCSSCPAVKIPLQYLNLALAVNGVGMTKHCSYLSVAAQEYRQLFMQSYPLIQVETGLNIFYRFIPILIPVSVLEIQ